MLLLIPLPVRMSSGLTVVLELISLYYYPHETVGLVGRRLRNVCFTI